MTFCFEIAKKIRGHPHPRTADDLPIQEALRLGSVFGGASKLSNKLTLGYSKHLVQRHGMEFRKTQISNEIGRLRHLGNDLDPFLVLRTGPDEET